MTKTAAHFMAVALEKAGVERVYGVVGDSERFYRCPAGERKDRMDPREARRVRCFRRGR
jgi:hypothetical protein